MSSTIDRASLNDDTGNGTSGDVWDSTLIGSAIYDKIDNLIDSDPLTIDSLGLGGTLSAVQTDVTTTGTTNNHAPTTIVTRWAGASQWTITGIVPARDGDIRIYHNVSTGQVIKFTSGDTGSTAGNRLSLATPNSGQFIGPGGSIGFRYDGTSDVWRPLFIEPGAAIDWDPILTGTTSASGQTYSEQEAVYSQRGAEVHVEGRLVLSAVGTITGSAAIGSLPLTARSGYRSVASIHNSGGALTTSVVSLSGQIASGESVIRLYKRKEAATTETAMVQADFASTTQLFFAATYFVD